MVSVGGRAGFQTAAQPAVSNPGALCLGLEGLGWAQAVWRFPGDRQRAAG